MSTPHVSGLAGLLYSYYTGFTSSQIRGTILRYVDPLPTLSGLIQTGGRINAYRSISSLSPPTGLSFIPSTNQIIVNWTNHATGADQYTIEHKSGSDSYSIAATLNADIHSFTDAGLIDGTAYTYMVKAINYLPNPPGADAIRTESLPLEATTATLIKSPTGLTATAVSSFQVTLAWTETSQTEEGFAIERSSDGNFAQIAVVGPNVVTYSDSGLSPATKYTYRVRAFNTAAGNSAYSNEAAVTTLTTGGSPVTGGGGGGCSIGARQNTPTAVADLAVMLIPLMVLVVTRRRR